MKKMFMSEVFYIIFIVVISSVLRLTYLDRIPTAIGQDEIDYQLTSKSISISGKDISGTISPIDILQFHYPPTDSPKAELPYFLNLPVMWITDFSLLSARITFALISIMTIIIFYFISKYFFGKEIGMIAGLLFAINPWEIFIGRTSFEVIPALFFFLLFFYLFLIFDKWKLIMTIPIILCAFYSYVATKIILFPFLLSIIYYLYFVEKRTKNKYQYLLIILLTFGISALFYVSIHSQGNSRIGDIFSPFSSNISNEVNELRKNTITTDTLPLFDNKIAVFGRLLIVKFFETISPEYLFLYGDSFISMWRHGIFYIIDGIFFIVGCVYIVKSQTKKIVLFTSLILLSILPHLIHKGSGTFTPHIALLFPLVFMIAACGIYSGWSCVAIQLKKVYCIGVFLLYSLSFGYFSHIYFFYYPIKSQSFDFSSRVLSRYITLATKQGKTITIFSSYPEDIFKKYIFYSSSLEVNTQTEIASAFKHKKYDLQNVSIRECGDSKRSDITIYDTNCKESTRSEKRISIGDIADSGERYRIYNDFLCNNVRLPLYVPKVTLNDLAVEDLNMDKLCSTYFIK